jgi:LacI family transcriptional regulator
MQTLDGENRRLVRRQVADHVKELIRAQRLRSGDRLPTYDELCAATGASLVTVKRGMDMLDAEGIVRCIHGRGSFVRRELVRTGRPLKTIGIIYPASYGQLFSLPYLRQIMQGIGEEAKQVDVNIFTLHEEGFVTASQLADRHIDGVVLIGVENDDLLGEFASWSIPGVVADYCSPRIPLDFVACDNAKGVEHAVRHLVELGHRRIQYVGRDPHIVHQVGKHRTLLMRSSDHIERRESAVRVLSATPGIHWDDTILANLTYYAHLPDLVPGWLRGAEWPTAFLVDDEGLAAELIAQFKAAGARVPEDVSVCVVAGPLVPDPHPGAVTGIGFDFVTMGRKAAELLKWRCEQPAEALSPAVYRVGYEWVEGGSTREARAEAGGRRQGMVDG